jgi:hypothetical protein
MEDEGAQEMQIQRCAQEEAGAAAGVAAEGCVGDRRVALRQGSLSARRKTRGLGLEGALGRERRGGEWTREEEDDSDCVFKEIDSRSHWSFADASSGLANFTDRPMVYGVL